MNQAVLMQKTIYTGCVFLICFIVSFLARRGIRFIFSKLKKRVTEYALAKTRTIQSLVMNVVDTIVFILCLFEALLIWGVNITPFLTGAGIIGLAFSFGAQTLIKDIISGFFIITEDQYNVGDTVKILAHEGEVIKITLRLTVLKDKTGNIIYIPNSQITSVIRAA